MEGRSLSRGGNKKINSVSCPTLPELAVQFLATDSQHNSNAFCDIVKFTEDQIEAVNAQPKINQTMKCGLIIGSVELQLQGFIEFTRDQKHCKR